MPSTSEQSGRAMGLVKAAHSSWKNSKGSETEATELRQEFEARLAALATHGFQAVEYSGSIILCALCEGTPLPEQQPPLAPVKSSRIRVWPGEDKCHPGPKISE
jgi:hypothetical protein